MFETKFLNKTRYPPVAVTLHNFSFLMFQLDYVFRDGQNLLVRPRFQLSQRVGGSTLTTSGLGHSDAGCYFISLFLLFPKRFS